MKKISMFMMGAAAIAMAACNGNKTDAAANAIDSVATDAVEAVDSAATSAVEAVDSAATEAVDAVAGNPVDKYAEMVNKAMDLAQKVKGGDAAAATESQNLAQEMMKLAQSPEFQESLKNPENLKKYQELAKKATDMAQSMMK